MITILAFVFVLGVLVFIHEFGHFIMAKMVGIRVERFSLGFPPRMFGKQIGETDYCISWIPIGGYVKMSGMIDESMEKDSIKGEPWEFMSKPVYQRFLVIFAGPLMNILLALFIFSMASYISGINEPTGTMIGAVEQNSFAATAGFEEGDMITAIDDQPVATWGDILEKTGDKNEVLVTWSREDQVFSQRMNASFVDSVRRTLPAIVGEVLDEYPASSVGIRSGDQIVAVNDTKIVSWEDLTEQIHALPEEEITIYWKRDGEILSSKITPVKEQTDGTGRIGISFLTHKKSVGFFKSFSLGTQYSINLIKLVYKSLKSVIVGEESC